MANKTAEILKDNKLRVTSCRREVLNTFLVRKIALSHADLEDALKDNFDRVTIYRTLKTFLENDLVHKVLDDTGAAKYALCNHGTDEAHHDHEHVHFKCEKCGNTSCLEDISLPKISLPKGYNPKEMSLLIQGTCNKCK
ncbi:Fur family transcriptional regulator [Cyclobacterium marinum]|uniref:Ferric uptake regulator, Fur family n=1 Tax=Cyclobacterium marinum (strain ATCC 25205 / DSM 745 / LMG 13164 / NCIMB 1802) TaxID=880070 RepID=G0J5T1_CYCMS|nr:transcriptional repressor [Cyclobacterium marinum]AEL25382.1 ferric uptake regulator, Fur family [Cyclobacterium marinum DSM 745]MBI0400822.1 transcriptional repressor [Cyclobacterium marinum]MBR9774973.1 transcriptional repressor [Cytophagales bacterium]|tara:strand:- start:30426 stop:30842 length:417 start_codon:yes stop_codon:yes gene_type:complete